MEVIVDQSEDGEVIVTGLNATVEARLLLELHRIYDDLVESILGAPLTFRGKDNVHPQDLLHTIVSILRAFKIEPVLLPL